MIKPEFLNLNGKSSLVRSCVIDIFNFPALQTVRKGEKKRINFKMMLVHHSRELQTLREQILIPWCNNPDN